MSYMGMSGKDRVVSDADRTYIEPHGLYTVHMWLTTDRLTHARDYEPVMIQRGNRTLAITDQVKLVSGSYVYQTVGGEPRLIGTHTMGVVTRIKHYNCHSKHQRVVAVRFRGESSYTEICVAMDDLELVHRQLDEFPLITH